MGERQAPQQPPFDSTYDAPFDQTYHAPFDSYAEPAAGGPVDPTTRPHGHALPIDPRSPAPVSPMHGFHPPPGNGYPTNGQVFPEPGPTGAPVPAAPPGPTGRTAPVVPAAERAGGGIASPGTGTTRDAERSGPRSGGRRVSAGSEPGRMRRFTRLLELPLVSGLLLAWSLTTLVGDVRWGPFSVLPVGLSCLSPIVTLAAIPLITVSLRRRRWFPVAPAVVAAALPWAFVLGYASPAPPPATRTVGLRAMIVTAHNGSADADDIVSAARQQQLDLVVVTELSGQLAHDLTQAGLTSLLTPRYVDIPASGSPAAGIGIYSRLPVEGITPLAGTHWPAVQAQVDVGAARFTLVAGHAVPPTMDHLDRWRQDLAAFGATTEIRGPVVVLANLNATPWQWQFRKVVSGRLHDAGDVLGRGLRPTWPAWGLPLLPTDHALVAGGVGVDSLDTAPVDGSDHRALVVGLEVPTR